MSRFADLENNRAGLCRALVLGSARRALEIPESLAVSGSRSATTLNLLAALAWRGSCDRPPPPPALHAGSVRHAQERLVDTELRKLLCGLFHSRTRYTTDAVPLRALDALHATGQEAHPYDFHTLDKWLAKDPRIAGKAAAAWLAFAAGAVDSRLGGDWEQVDDESWQNLTPAMAAAYLRWRRGNDPKSGRELCASVLAENTAATRVKLLGALEVSLSAEDVPLLQASLEDRAASVRTQAVRLLARIEGTQQYRDRLRTAAEALNVRKGKLIGPRVQIDLYVPGSVAKGKHNAWIQELFQGVDPQALCERLELKEETFCSGVCDPELRGLLFLNGLVQGREAFAAGLAAELNPETRIAIASSPQLAHLASENRPQVWQMLLAGAMPKTVEALHWMMASLYTSLRCTPPGQVYQAILSARAWRDYTKQAAKDPKACDPEVAELLVALAPSTAHSRLAEQLASLPPMLMSRAMRLSELFTRLQANE